MSQHTSIDKIMSEQAGQALTLGAVYLVSLLWAFNIGFFKSLTLSVVVVVCYLLHIGQRRLGQIGVALLFLTVAVSANLLPLVSEWRPAIQTYVATLPMLAQARP